MSKKKICLQAGHVNIKNNSIVSLRGGTGAPNEAKFNQAICDGLKTALSPNFDVTVTDGCANDNKTITSTDYDLFLAVHYDADIYNDTGGFVDYADPASDAATLESQRIAKILSDEYFGFTGIKNMPKRSNANTRFYYMWQYLTDKTPCVLIECGIGQRKPKDYDLLWDNQPKVIEGIVNGINKAFGIVVEEDSKAYWKKEAKLARTKVEDLQKQLDKAKEDLEKLKDSSDRDVQALKTQLEDSTRDWQAKENKWNLLEKGYMDTAFLKDKELQTVKEDLRLKQEELDKLYKEKFTTLQELVYKIMEGLKGLIWKK